MVFGFLLFSIVDFTLAAPVPVQEKRQVDVMHIPRDVVTVLEKRGDEDIEKLAKYFETWEGAHASSSSAAPQGPEHGSVNNVQAAASNPVPSEANPNPLVEPSSPLSPLSSTYTPTSTGYYGSDDESMVAHGSQPNSSPRPLTDPDSIPEWDYWINSEDPEHQADTVQPLDPGLSPQENGVANGHRVDDVQQPNPGLFPQENGVANGHQVGEVQQPNPGLSPQENGMANGYHVDQGHSSPSPSTDPDPSFDRHYWMSSEGRPVPRPASPTENGVAYGYQLDPGPSNPGSSNPRPSTRLSGWDYWPDLEHLPVLRPSPGPPPQADGVANGYQVDRGHSSPRPETDPDLAPNFDWHYWMSSEDRPVPTPASHVEQPGLSGPRPDSDVDGYWFGSDK